MADVSKTGFTNAAYQVCYSIRADDARTELAQMCESGPDFQETKHKAAGAAYNHVIKNMLHYQKHPHLNIEYFIPGRAASITANPSDIESYMQAIDSFMMDTFNVFKEMRYVSSIDQLTCSISATLGEPYPVASCKTAPIFEGD